MIIPVTYKMYGPAQTSGAILTQATSAPIFVGQVLSGSTQKFNFSRGIPQAAYARLLVLWASRNTANYVQLICCDDGPTNIVEIGRLYGNGNMGVSAQGLDITAAFNSLVVAGLDKQVGFRIGGDGVNAWSLYGLQLEIEYEVPDGS